MEIFLKGRSQIASMNKKGKPPINMKSVFQKDKIPLLPAILGPPAGLLIRALATGQELQGSKSESGIDVCSGSDSTFNRGSGLFSISKPTNPTIF